MKTVCKQNCTNQLDDLHLFNFQINVKKEQNIINEEGYNFVHESQGSKKKCMLKNVMNDVRHFNSIRLCIYVKK